MSGTALAHRMGEVFTKHLLKGGSFWVPAIFSVEYTEYQMGLSKIQTSSSASQSKSLSWLLTAYTMGSKLLVAILQDWAQVSLLLSSLLFFHWTNEFQLCLITCGFPNTLFLPTLGCRVICWPLPAILFSFIINNLIQRAYPPWSFFWPPLPPQINFFLCLFMVWLYIIIHIPFIIVTGLLVSSFR